MPAKLPDPKQLGYYYALAQVGLEMVAPLGIGVALDYYLKWTAPWGAVVGAILGLIGGIAHLAAIANRRQDSGSSSKPRDER
jgi:F0F1-type ATP synthase assembly protein I